MKTINQAVIGPELRALRMSRGISVKAMAITLDINASYLSQLEHGKRPHWSAARREAYLKYCDEVKNQTPLHLQPLAKPLKRVGSKRTN